MHQRYTIFFVTTANAQQTFPDRPKQYHFYSSTTVTTDDLSGVESNRFLWFLKGTMQLIRPLHNIRNVTMTMKNHRSGKWKRMSTYLIGFSSR